MRGVAATYLRAVGMRLAAGIPVFILVTFLATALSDFMPGSAAHAILGDQATPEQIARVNAQYGFDQPVLVRYAAWLAKAAQGDFGRTLYSQQSVAELVVTRAAATFEIAILAMLVALTIAIPLAMFTSIRPGGFTDTVMRLLSSVMLSVPIFVTVVLLGWIFSLVLRWLPATGWADLTSDPLGNLRYVALPVMCLAVHQTAYFYRVCRSEFSRTLQEDFVLVARARGLSARYILTRHVLRPSLPQVLTVFGLSMTHLLGGSFIIESYFAVPGIGWTVLDAVKSHDFPVVQALLSLTVAIFVVVFMLVDLGYAIIDPRVEVA